MAQTQTISQAVDTELRVFSLAAKPDAPPVTAPELSSQPTTDNAIHPAALRKGTTAIIFTSIAGVTLISSMLAGVVTVALPHMVVDLSIPQSLLLWPSSIYALTCGCALIISGAVADVAGARFMYILGAALQSVWTLACGLAQTSTQMIVFRGLAGVAIAFCLPSAVSLVTSYFPHGRRRNMAFATMGGGQALGFAVGLVLGGVLSDSPASWRGAFYIAAGINTIVLLVTFFGLPKLARDEPFTWSRLAVEIDWTGAILLSASLGLLSYVFATLTGSVSTIREPITITLLSLAVVLVPVFSYWVHRQEKLGRPAIIPNSIWRNRIFTSICISVFLLWGAFNASEALLTFYFQDVQFLSATESSIRFLPLPIVGVISNAIIGAC
jgi:MFS family permease